MPRTDVPTLLEHSGWIRGFCRSLVGADDGDDLAQETWLVALRHSSAGLALERPRPWLATVARRLARDRRRSVVRRAAREQAAARGEQSADTSTLVERSELAHLVAGEVLALREPYRSTLLLRYVQGLDATAIGARLGAPPATVRSRLARGLAQVRDALDRRHAGDRSRWMAALTPLLAPEAKVRAGATGAVVAGAVLVLGALAAGLGWRPFGAPAPSAAAPAVLAGPQDPAPAPLPLVDPARAPVEAPAPAPVAVASRVPTHPRIAWHHPAPQRAAVRVDGERVLSVSRDLECLSIEDGSVLWRVAGGDGGPWAGSPARHVGAFLLVHTSGAAASFDVTDGSLRWARSPEDVRATGQPGRLVTAGARALFVVGTRDGVAALSVDDGSIAWRAALPGEVALRPAFDGTRILCGTDSGSFFALSIEGEVLWRYDSGARFGWTDPVVADGVVYVGDRGKGGSHDPRDAGKLVSSVPGNRAGALNALDTSSGELIWGRIFGATGLSQPFVTATHVWVGFGSVVAAFERETGEVRPDEVVRTGRNAFGSPRVLDGRIVFGNLDGNLYVHDLEQRELLWRFTPGADTQVGGWSAARGKLLVATTRGLFALEQTPDVEPLPRGSVLHAPAPSGAPDLTGAPGPPGVPESAAAATVTAAPIFESSVKLAQAWAEAIAPQEGEVDGVLREAALAEVREALTGDDATRARGALGALARCAGAEGVSALRAWVEPWVLGGSDEVSGGLRVDALRALLAVGPAPGATLADDLALVHASWEHLDAPSRRSIPYLLTRFGAGVIEGRSEELVLELLDADEDAVFRDWANGLWGARVTDGLAARLVQRIGDARGGSTGYDALYYCLSTFDHKQPMVLDVLLDALHHPDSNWSRRALWGLGHGVPQAHHSALAAALLARLPEVEASLRPRMRDLVRRYGTPAQVEAAGQ